MTLSPACQVVELNIFRDFNHQPLTPENVDRSTLSSMLNFFHGEFALPLIPDKITQRYLSGCLSDMSQSLQAELETVEASDHKSISHIAYSYGAIQKISFMLTGISQQNIERTDMFIADDPEKQNSLLFYAEEIPKLEEEIAKHPNLPVANKIFEAELLVRGLYNQWKDDLTDDKSQNFTKTLYKHILTKYNNHEKLASNYTDHDVVRSQLKDTLTILRESGKISKSPRILLIGPATGLDVEGPVLSQLMEDNLLGNCTVIGVDPEEYSQHWAGMKMSQMSLNEYAKATKNNPNFTRFDLVISTGSVFNNNESLHEWLLTMQSLDELTNDNATFLYETGDIDTTPEINLRTNLAKSMNEARPSMFWGMYGIIEAYRDTSDSPHAYGATLFPRQIYRLLFEFAGFNDWLSDKPYQASGESDIRMMLVTQKKHRSTLSQTIRDTLEFVSRLYASPEQVKG